MDFTVLVGRGEVVVLADRGSNLVIMRKQEEGMGLSGGRAEVTKLNKKGFLNEMAFEP